MMIVVNLVILCTLLFFVSGKLGGQVDELVRNTSQQLHNQELAVRDFTSTMSISALDEQGDS